MINCKELNFLFVKINENTYKQTNNYLRLQHIDLMYDLEDIIIIYLYIKIDRYPVDTNDFYFKMKNSSKIAIIALIFLVLEYILIDIKVI